MDKSPSKEMEAKVQMTSNRMFPLKITPYLKEGDAQVQVSMNSQEDEIKAATITQVNFQAEDKDEKWLWHLIFGHLNFGGLKLLHRKVIVKVFPLTEKIGSLYE